VYLKVLAIAVSVAYICQPTHIQSYGHKLCKINNSNRLSYMIL